MRAQEFLAETYNTDVFRMAKLQKDGRVVRILKHKDQVSFSDEQGWLLIDVTPGRQRPETMKWIPDTTKFDWVREFNSAVDENFADGKKPGRKGLSKRVGIPKKASLSQLQKIASSSTGERRRMAQWQLNMRRGKAKNK
jgi:hypothetical protein